MIIRKLNWAGLQLNCGDKVILIDAVENFKPYLPVLGHPLTPLVEFTSDTRADYILFTHLHLDHFDVSVFAKCLKPGGKIIGYQKHENVIRNLGYDFVLLGNDQSWEENGIVFKSVYAMDGIGEEQTAWIVSYKGTSIFHGGDTIWHNQFWKLGKENPGINYAFLPVNGALVNFEIIGLEYSTIPASLTPEQAFNAAKLLHARELIPIHYGKFASRLYQPVDTSEAIFENCYQLTQQPYQLLPDGAYLKQII
jgi:L-ascorbate metabolism protein UlaG (beta-lactamase superfamily)